MLDGTVTYRMLEQPNDAYKQWRFPRRTYLYSGLPAHGGQVTGGIILHSAEGGTDLVGADLTAEKVAQFICTRDTPGGYHVLVDRDSTILMAPPDYEVWHDTTSNPYTVSVSVAWNKADLPRMSYAQRVEYYERIARAVLDLVAWFRAVKGIVVPLDRVLTRAEIMAGKPGLSTHSRMDPTRRSDPFGTGSPYEAEFLAVLARLAGAQTPAPPAPATPTQEDDEMYLIRAKDTGKVYATDGVVKNLVEGYTLTELQRLTGGKPIVTLGQYAVDRIPDAVQKPAPALSVAQITAAVAAALAATDTGEDLDAAAFAADVAGHLAGGVDVKVTATPRVVS